jgi:protease-4
LGLLFGILGVSVAMIGLAGGALWYVASQVGHGEVEQDSFLEVRLEGELSDAPATPGFLEDPSDTPPNVHEIARAVRKAATDDRIDGLYLRFEPVGAGWGSWQELSDAVRAFRASGKPCVAHSDLVLDDGSYFLAASCGNIVVPEAAILLVNGLDVSLSYYKGTFDKLGVTPEYEHVGDFKSFIEVYERTGPSEQAAAAYDGMLDSLYGQLVAGIAAGRGVTPEVARGWIEAPTLVPAAAVERGMIDAIGWEESVAAHLRDLDAPDWAARVAEPVGGDEADADRPTTPLDDYLAEIRDEDEAPGDKIAVVYAEGQIVNGAAGGLFGDQGMLTETDFASWMADAREDDEVKAVVVRVNSPGGSASAAQDMWKEVARTQAAGKPVVISMGDYAASGGYLMSCDADWIVAQPGTLTGSIGVFGGKFDTSGLWGKLGVTRHAFKRGELADMLSLSTPFTSASRAVFREYLESFYKTFVDDVAQGRGRSWDEIHQVAQGRVWTGEQAIGHHLVDEIGGFEAALTKAAALADVSDYGVRPLPARQSFFDQLLEDMEGDAAAAAAVPQALLSLTPEVRDELALLDAIHRAGGVAAYLPGVPTAR